VDGVPNAWVDRAKLTLHLVLRPPFVLLRATSLNGQ
jgi:hypothetical protein